MRTRRVLLTPVGGLPAPSGVEVREAWLDVGVGECRVIQRDTSFAMLFRTTPVQPWLEQPLLPMIGNALLKGARGPHLEYRASDWGDSGTIRQYTGDLWGLVIGELDEDEPAAPPRGFTIGRDITGDARYLGRALAAMGGFSPQHLRPLPEGAERTESASAPLRGP